MTHSFPRHCPLYADNPWITRTSRVMTQAVFVLLVCLISNISLSPAQAAPRTKFLDIQSHTTDKGLSFWLVEDHSLPIVALEFAFDGAGAALDPADKQGLSRLASNTMDEGAGDLSAEAFQNELRTQSISLSFSSSRDTFGGSLKTRATTLEQAEELLHLALTQPRFEDKDIQRMKDANIARIRESLSDPEWIAARFVNDLAFAGHPYALNSGGTLSTLQALSSKDLKAFVTTRLARKNLKIALVGDLSVAQASALVDKVFGGLPEAPATTTSVADLTLQHSGQTYLYDLDIPQTVIQGVLPALNRKDPDYYAFQVMNQILGAGGFGSRLTEEIREKRGLTYGIYTYLTQMTHVDYLTLGVSTANENAGEVLRLAATELSKMATSDVSEKELSEAISYINGSLPLTLTSTSNIAELLLGMQLDDLPVDYLDHRAAHFDAVTAADVRRVAQKYLKPESMMTMIVGAPTRLTEKNVTKLSVLPNVQ
ncbi:MAG: insulinase family protein [Rhodospirillales bacterium]|nr:insulinase family protein [Rhodospirillales bacterium]MCB9964806.1 insulinase family protein [Rhodospirillales bacterium]MCB9980488.1 insulinase family protein [Rhodospirillales bacterium]